MSMSALVKRKLEAVMRMQRRFSEEGRSSENFGVNLAFLENGVMLDLLIEKGLITREEYDRRVTARLERQNISAEARIADEAEAEATEEPPGRTN